MDPLEDDPQLTSEELAARWKRRVEWVHQAARDGSIPGAWKAGRYWRFSLSEIRAHEQASKTESVFALTDASKSRRKKAG